MKTKFHNSILITDNVCLNIFCIIPYNIGQIWLIYRPRTPGNSENLSWNSFENNEDKREEQNDEILEKLRS